MKEAKYTRKVLTILNEITAAMEQADSKEEAFKVLRQGMAYCWSIAVAALPSEGKSIFEKWLRSPSKDIRWVMKENLKKYRLSRADAGWVKVCIAKLDQFDKQHKRTE